eukprot:3417149-Rhodomonas_salina.1
MSTYLQVVFTALAMRNRQLSASVWEAWLRGVLHQRRLRHIEKTKERSYRRRGLKRAWEEWEGKKHEGKRARRRESKVAERREEGRKRRVVREWRAAAGRGRGERGCVAGQRYPTVLSATCLCACYAVSGTELAYGATSLYACARRCPVLTLQRMVDIMYVAISLRVCKAIRGTNQFRMGLNSGG